MNYVLHSLLFLVAVTAVPAPAPPGRNIAIRVILNSCSGDFSDIKIVLNGDEKNQPPLTRTEKGWEGEWIDDRAEKFPGAPLSASVRFRDGRTYCAVAKAEKDQNDAPRAVFDLTCEGAVRTVTIGTIKPTTFAYERRLPQKADSVVPFGHECDEKGEATGGTRIIFGMMFPIENLSIHFIDRKKNRSSDLLILDPHGEVPAAAIPEIFDPFVRKNGVAKGDEPRCTAGMFCLRRAAIIRAMGQQRAKYRPDLVPQDYSVDERILSDPKLLLTIAVK